MSDWLHTRAQTTPQNVALIIGERQWTYAQLDGLVNGVYGRLHTAGITPGQKVGMLMPNCLAYVCMVHALARLGAVLVPLNTRLTAPEIVWQLEHVNCNCLVHDETFTDTARQLNCQLLMVNGQLSMNTLPPFTIHNSQFTIHNSLHSLVFTSGTTGRPKAVMLSYANHFWSATASAFRLGLHTDDRWLSCLPLYHVGGLAVLFRSCLYGTAVILHNGFDVAAINHSLDNQAATLVSLVPTMLYRLLPSRTHWPPSLRLILLGGAAAPPALIQQANALPNRQSFGKLRTSSSILRQAQDKFVNRQSPIVATTYGLTEAASQVTTMLPADVVRKPGSVGKPLMFTSVRIVGDDGAELPPGEYGELVVSGPTVMAGYYGESEIGHRLVLSNAEGLTRMHADFPPTSGHNELYTGDIGYPDEDGDLWLVQRRSDLIVSGGENVYPAQVEGVLRGHTAVSAACVVGIDHPEWGQQVAAMVVLHPGRTLTQAELLTYCRSHLAGYKLPRLVRFVDNLPQTASGKIHRRGVVEILRP